MNNMIIIYNIPNFVYIPLSLCIVLIHMRQDIYSYTSRVIAYIGFLKRRKNNMHFFYTGQPENMLMFKLGDF